MRDSLGQVTNTIVRLKYETYQYKNYSLVANKEVPIIEEHQEDSQKSQISKTLLKKNQVQIPKMPEIIQLNPASEVIRHQPVPLVFVPKHPRPQVIQRQPTLMINPQNVPKMMQSATTQQVIQNNPNPPVQILQSMNSSQKPTQIVQAVQPIKALMASPQVPLLTQQQLLNLMDVKSNISRHYTRQRGKK